MSETKNYRDESRKDWHTNDNEPLTSEEIRFGAILRIADAAEKMAMNYQKLITERDRYEQGYALAEKEIARLARSNAALRGVIKRIKKERKK